MSKGNFDYHFFKFITIEPNDDFILTYPTINMESLLSENFKEKTIKSLIPHILAAAVSKNVIKYDYAKMSELYIKLNNYQLDNKERKLIYDSILVSDDKNYRKHMLKIYYYDNKQRYISNERNDNNQVSELEKISNLLSEHPTIPLTEDNIDLIINEYMFKVNIAYVSNYRSSSEIFQMKDNNNNTIFHRIAKKKVSMRTKLFTIYVLFDKSLRNLPFNDKNNDGETFADILLKTMDDFINLPDDYLKYTSEDYHDELIFQDFLPLFYFKEQIENFVICGNVNKDELTKIVICILESRYSVYENVIEHIAKIHYTLDLNKKYYKDKCLIDIVMDKKCIGDGTVYFIESSWIRCDRFCKILKKYNRNIEDYI